MPGYDTKLAEVKKGLDRRFSLVQGPTNLQRIKELLTTPPGTHVFHFLGHGELEEDTGKAILFLEKEDGTADIVDGADLVAEFQTLSPKPALVFLAACDSAKRTESGAIQLTPGSPSGRSRRGCARQPVHSGDRRRDPPNATRPAVSRR